MSHCYPKLKLKIKNRKKKKEREKNCWSKPIELGINKFQKVIQKHTHRQTQYWGFSVNGLHYNAQLNKNTKGKIKHPCKVGTQTQEIYLLFHQRGANYKRKVDIQVNYRGRLIFKGGS